ncbi:Branching enzyme [Handroanthus impetiginosus]|uniref:Branching enzyme n=1 Tax=Handroanthus impetiginosus TaxID=429701 RepID=A0A2G9HB78_9LAMI|nr:Branching enzyme [Handroanthus impetiginosus]
MGAEKKWLFTLFSGAFITLLIFLSFISGFSSSYYYAFPPHKPFPSTVHHEPGHPPSFAYYISGGRGDGERLFRLLLAVYHPRNRYLLHISADGSDDERLRLGTMVKSMPAVQAFGNVDVIGKPDPYTYMGSTNIAAILRAAAVLLKVDGGWDWFVTLSAMDYPLITQDDLSHVFSSIRRDLNFIDHTSDLGWKEGQRIQPIVVDPGIYLARRTQIFHATEKRPMPDAFRVFTGSPWVVLSRSFVEFCVFGWDNLPRTLLMYVTNVVLSQEVYFHSVICNSPEFKNTTVNADLRYFVWDDPPKMEPHFLNTSDYDEMIKSGAAFARQFEKDRPVLDMIDRNILNRGRNRVTPGAWCRGRRSWWIDPCSQWGDVNVVKPGPQAKKFGESIDKLLDDWNSQSNSCT